MNIIQILPGKVWGGAEQYVIDLSKELIRHGHHVTFVSRRSKVITEIIKRKFQLKTLPFMFTLDLFTAYLLASIIRKENIDVIHIHDVRFIATTVLAKKWSKRDVKIILTRHVARASHTSLFLRRNFVHLHYMIFVSQMAYDLWINTNGWMPKDKCKVILNSIPFQENEEHIETFTEKFALDEGIPIIVFTGRVRKSKGCMVLLQAVARLKKFRFHLVYIGKCKPDSYESKLRKEANLLGISGRVSFYGFTKQARHLIYQADIGVVPSIVCEACPLSPMEFMQAGKYVITTDNGAQQEYIKDNETGMLVPPGDVEKLSDALLKAIINKQERFRIGQNAQLYFNHSLSYDKFYQKTINCYI